MSKFEMLEQLKPITGKELLDKLVVIMFTLGICGIALKFVKTIAECEYNQMYVFFPLFPNIIDCIFLIFGASYLGWKAFKNAK
ncbi:hypothetical protein ES702_03932 [subsurface metagenome]